MIAVLADDFTGAAEIGGVGVRHGLTVRIETVVHHEEHVDLLVVATDTRSMTAADAAAEVARMLKQIQALQPEFIYKKIDSVLRGHVGRELEVQMDLMQKPRALVVAPNPAVGRTIEGGRYFVDGIELDQTFFAGDPDFPVVSPSVLEMVKPLSVPVFSRSIGERLPEKGIIVANVAWSAQLQVWAACTGMDMVLAGGSGFFDAILESKYKTNNGEIQPELSFGTSSLFILGSLFPKHASFLNKFNHRNVTRINMPDDLYYGHGNRQQLIESWADEVSGFLVSGSSVMLSIDQVPHKEEGLACRIRENIGRLTAEVATRIQLTDLFIEGGATTSTVLKHLNITRLEPFFEADFGVIQLRADGYPGLVITTKPGSYLWPEKVEF